MLPIPDDQRCKAPQTRHVNLNDLWQLRADQPVVQLRSGLDC
jgi:hypothetical protein